MGKSSIELKKNVIIRYIVCIIFYFLLMEVLGNFIASIVFKIYLSIKGIDAEMVGEDDLFSLSIYSNIAIYALLIGGIVIILGPIIKELFQRNNRMSCGNYWKYVGVGLAIAYGATYIGSMITGLFSETESVNEESITLMLLSKNGFYLIFMVCLVGPIVEELIFRECFMGLLLKKCPPIIAIVVSGALFGLLHVFEAGDYVQVFPYLFMGLAFGFIYYWSNKNIMVTILIHIMWNCFSTFITYLTPILEMAGAL